MDVLRASGTFDVNGWFGLAGWPSINLNTNGEKRFEAKLVNATLEPVIEIDIDGGCDDEGNAIITEMNAVGHCQGDGLICSIPYNLKLPSWRLWCWQCPSRLWM